VGHAENGSLVIEAKDCSRHPPRNGDVTKDDARPADPGATVSCRG